MSARIMTWSTIMLFLCAAPVWAGELITNGTFEGAWAGAGVSGPLDGLPDTIPVIGWTRVEGFTGGAVENALITSVAANGPSAPGAVAARFDRALGGGSGDRSLLRQPLNITASAWPDLILSMDVQVRSHNLEAGGWVPEAFEWPAVVQINYTDTANNPQTWRFGWYIDPPGDFVSGQVNDPGKPGGLIQFYNDQLVPVNQWVTTSFNLTDELPQVKTIDTLYVGGAGWDFHGYVDNVSLRAVPEPTTLALVAAGSLALLRRRRRRR